MRFFANMNNRSSAFISCLLDNLRQVFFFTYDLHSQAEPFLKRWIHEPSKNIALFNLTLTNDESIMNEVRVENSGISNQLDLK